jgi:hypothetical protein
MNKLALSVFACASVALGADVVDDKWPQFRGPGGLGIGLDKVTLPSEFGPSKALLWKPISPSAMGLLACGANAFLSLGSILPLGSWK